jgi:ATPase subunit of ABC transporter with duplicated ATPase domains
LPGPWTPALSGIEQLETALDACGGTLLLVTHDRHPAGGVALDRTSELGSSPGPFAGAAASMPGFRSVCTATDH